MHPRIQTLPTTSVLTTFNTGIARSVDGAISELTAPQASPLDVDRQIHETTVPLAEKPLLTSRKDPGWVLDAPAGPTQVGGEVDSGELTVQVRLPVIPAGVDSLPRPPVSTWVPPPCRQCNVRFSDCQERDDVG